MGDFKIESFKYGLDSRRDVLSSVAGTLEVLDNSFVNAGGQLEKVKAFERFAILSDFDSNGDRAIFDLLSTDAGLLVFSHALAFGASITQGQPTLTSAIPVGLVLMQIKHPSLVNDAAITYDRTYHRITSIAFSISHNGKAYVSAIFADTRTYLYYDGTLIQDSVNGMVLEGRTTLADLSDDLTRQFGYIDWSATANTDENGVAQNGSTTVLSPQTNYFGVVNSETSTLGFFGNRFISQDIAPVEGVKAVAGFLISVNTGPFNVSAPNQVSAVTPTIDLCGGDVVALGSAALTAAAISQAVNDFTNVHGYTSVVVGANVFVYAPLNYDVSVPFDLTVTGATTTTPSASPTGLTGTLSPDPQIFERIVSAPGVYTVGLPVSIHLTGTSGALGYTWSELGIPSGISFPFVNQGSSVDFRKLNMPVNTSVIGNFKVEVTDASVLAFTLFFTVKLTCTYNSGG